MHILYRADHRLYLSAMGSRCTEDMACWCENKRDGCTLLRPNELIGQDKSDFKVSAVHASAGYALVSFLLKYNKKRDRPPCHVITTFACDRLIRLAAGTALLVIHR
ncbi:hypothetical protein [Paenibacillus polymyxa]|uniref:hypothetical protein n=1 Tax=Paenibacillus polymyxa TaxID=1406 RepID=UPI0023F61732|nr:hypothetical protein [Paenibacillus polymyxa]